MAELNMEVTPELAALLDEVAANPSPEPKSLMAQGALKILSMHGRIAELENQLRLIVRHYDMREEIYNGVGAAAALAWTMANLARDVLTEDLQKSADK